MTPWKAEDGLSGLGHDQRNDQSIGQYDSSAFTDEELMALDREGRSVMTQHRIRSCICNYALVKCHALNIVVEGVLKTSVKPDLILPCGILWCLLECLKACNASFEIHVYNIHLYNIHLYNIHVYKIITCIQYTCVQYTCMHAYIHIYPQ